MENLTILGVRNTVPDKPMPSLMLCWQKGTKGMWYDAAALFLSSILGWICGYRAGKNDGYDDGFRKGLIHIKWKETSDDSDDQKPVAS